MPGGKNKLIIKVAFKRVVSLTLFFCLLTPSLFAQVELPISSATASSSYGSYTAPKSIDKNLATYWRGAARKTSWWLKLDSGNASALSQISIFWNKNYGSSNYNIQVSNDNTNWSNLYTALSSLGGATNPYQKDYPLSGAYRYVRIYINKAQNKYPIIYEVKLYGGSAPPQITGVIPSDGSTFYENETISIFPTVNINSPSLEYQFSVDGVIRQIWSNQSKYTLTAISGRHDIRVEVRDAGGQDRKEIEIYVFRRPLSPP